MKRCLILILFTSFLGWSQAESRSDYNTWVSFNVEKGVAKNFSVGGRAEFRTQDHFSKTDYWILRILANYKALPWLKFTVGYDFMGNKKYDKSNGVITLPPFYKDIHRVFLDVTGKYSTHQFTFTLRERYIYATDTPMYLDYLDSTGKMQRWEYSPRKHSHLLRSKLKIAYGIKKTPLSPFISNELFIGRIFEQSRTCVGTGIKLNDVNSVSIYYMWQYKGTSTPKLHNHVIGVDFTVTLK